MVFSTWWMLLPFSLADNCTIGCIHFVVPLIQLVLGVVSKISLTQIHIIASWTNHKNVIRCIFEYNNIPCFWFQSVLDCSCSMALLISTVTITDLYKVHHTGILGWLECYLWNNEIFSFGLFLSSTWNIVVLTIERFVLLLYTFNFYEIYDGYVTQGSSHPK